ncbi:putative receptor-like protein kinase [Sesamum angolense]|uniref:Receptor-like protein kinase n=1 Tax=Sesamum angolense TaxID=2727404 RepID=A0AAE1XEZ3_9LAMI|nr:putative receptor-like protein kinase [Sesamum angolense]
MKFLFLLLLPIWLFSSPLFSAPLYVPATRPVAHPVLPADKDPSFRGSADLTARSPEVAKVKVVHHQDLNKKILIALVVASSLLGGILLLLSCFSFYRMKKLKECSAKSNQSSGPSCRSALTWHQRMKIALDVARGLEYLHEHCNPPVIHRDLKPSNIFSIPTSMPSFGILLQISDFGLAIAGGNSNKTNIKLTGTLGYVAPEYLLDGKLTDKSDVYAFGVVLLELLMGRRPVERVAETQCQSIVTWASPQLTDRSKLPNIVDPAIRNTMDLKHLYQVAAIAVLCVQPEASYRPLITDVLHSFIPWCLLSLEDHYG